MNRQAGQSMTEFAVGMTSLALLLLGSITIAGYQELQRRTVLAARQATFEGEWAGSGESRATAMRRAVEVQLNDPTLLDPHGNRYIESADISIEASVLPAPGRAQTASTLMLEPLRVAGGFLGGDFDLTSRGLLAGEVILNIPSRPFLPEPFATLQLELRQPISRLTDAWNAGSPGHVRDRVAGLVPASALSDLQGFWRPLLAPLTLVEPSLARLCLGIIEPDRVPEDRLGAGRTSLPGRCP